MTCRNIMQPDLFTAVDTVALGDALDLLSRNRVTALPVVDPGSLLRSVQHSFVSRLLPGAALVDDCTDLTNLAFVRDSLETLKVRVASRLKKPASTFMDRELQPLTPCDSLVEILFRLYRHHPAVSVVDPDSGPAPGIVTDWTVLPTLAGQTH